MGTAEARNVDTYRLIVQRPIHKKQKKSTHLAVSFLFMDIVSCLLCTSSCPTVHPLMHK